MAKIQIQFGLKIRIVQIAQYRQTAFSQQDKTAGSALANKNIAIHLGTTEKTVKVHRARVMAKMEAVSLADLVRMQERLLAGPEVQAAHPARPMGEEGVQPPLS